MPSTYTLNNGIELIGTGEQSGTWGDTTNTNLQLLDTALDGQVTVALASAGSSGSPNNLPVSDGATSNGRNRLIIFSDSSDLGATAYVQLTPNDSEKIIYVRNSLSGSRSIVLFQGTYNASNDYEVPAGTTAVVFFNGAGTGAVAANVFNNAYFDSLRLGGVSVTAILDEDNMASDSATALATQQSIKKYVDDKAAAQDTLAEVLANGNTTGGTDIVVSVDDVISMDNGTNLLPSLTTTGDLNTGLYFPAADEVGLTVGGTQRLNVSATGVDVTGALEVTTTALVTGVLTTTAATVFNGGFASNANSTITGAGSSAALLSMADTAGRGLSLASPADATEAELQTTSNHDLYITAGDSATNRLILRTDGTGERLRLSSSEAVFNEGSADTDFRVESDSNANMLFVDGGANAVGVGTGSPAAHLDVQKPTDGSGGEILRLRGGTYTSPIYAGGLSITTNTSSNYNRYWEMDASANLIFSRKVTSTNASDAAAVLTLTSGGAIFNDTGADMDFRVESDGNANMLFVDGGNNVVGINTSENQSAFALNVLGTGVSGGRAVKLQGPDANTATSTSAPQLVIANSNSTTGNFSALSFASSSGGTTAFIGAKTTNHGTNSGDVYIATRGPTNGYLNKVYIGDTSMVINDSGVNYDFRVESDTNTHALFVDASSRMVGIEQSAPAYLLDVGNGTSNISGGYTMRINSNGDTIFSLSKANTSVMSFRNDAYNYTAIASNNGSALMLGHSANDAGAIANHLIFTAGATTFNEGGVDRDFRVESDSNDHMLFVDAGNNRVGVGTSAPGYPLQVNGSTSTGAVAYGSTIDGISAKFNGENSSTSEAILIGNGRYSFYGATDAGIIFQPSGANNGYYPRVLQTCHRGNNATSTGSMRWYTLRQDNTDENGLYAMVDGAFSPLRDNQAALGGSGNRWTEVYAVNSTINTSDATLKEQVTDLSAAELQAATACKALIKKYKWISAVEEKGDDARWHVGVIAQEVQQAFVDAGLDAGDYSLFIRERWYEYTYGGRLEKESNVNEIPVPMEETTERTRLGIRYPELLAFIIAAL